MLGKLSISLEFVIVHTSAWLFLIELVLEDADLIGECFEFVEEGSVLVFWFTNFLLLFFISIDFQTTLFDF